LRENKKCPPCSKNPTKGIKASYRAATNDDEQGEKVILWRREKEKSSG